MDNPRRVYHEMYRDERDMLRGEREIGSRRRVYIDNEAMPVRSMTDSQIDTVAWRLAERAMNRAAWERKYADAEMRRRKSEAC